MNDNILFNNIDEKEINKVLKNIDGKVVIYKKNSSFSVNNLENNTVGIITNGNANLEKYDYNGNRIVIEKLEKNSLFGNIFYNYKSDINFVATTDCSIILFKYDIFLKKNKNFNLMYNLLNIYYKKIIYLNIRLEVLSKRSIKDKLLTYYSILGKYKKNKSIILPITYTELADYLSIDRSAMMREIKKMKEEKYIKTDGKKITIINY